MAISTYIFVIIVSAALTSLQLSLFPQFLPDLLTRSRYFFSLGITCILLAIWNLFIYPSFVSPFRNLPGPKDCPPIIGHGLIAIQRPFDRLVQFINDIPNDGIIRILGFFHCDRLLLTDPSSLSEVLVHKAYDFEKPSFLREFFECILGKGLVCASGNDHKFLRKHTLPGFAFQHIKALYPLFWTKAMEMNRCISSELHQQEGVVDISHWITKATMDIIGVAGFGHDFHSLTTSDNELVKSYEELVEPTAEKVVYMISHIYLPRWFITMLPWRLNMIFTDTTTFINRYCYQLVIDKKELIKTQSDNHVDILSVLLKSNNFTDDMIAQQLMTFLGAGHETTAAAFSWAVYLLSIYPEFQSQLREEIRTHLPSPKAVLDASLNLADRVESLPLLHAVCLETLRLYPPIPVTLRVAVKDTTIGSQPVPRGTLVYIAPWAINRCQKFWGAEATEFRPERWIDKETGRPNNTGGVLSNYNMLTFLHGHRGCIGEKFAKSELKVLIAVFCGTYSMAMANPEDVPIPSGAVTCKPKNGMDLRLTDVGGW